MVVRAVALGLKTKVAAPPGEKAPILRMDLKAAQQKVQR